MDFTSSLYDENPIVYSDLNKDVDGALQELAGIFGDDILQKAAVLPKFEFDSQKYEQSKKAFQTILDALGDPKDYIKTSKFGMSGFINVFTLRS